MINNYIRLSVMALGSLLLLPSAFAQEFTASDETAGTGATEVTATWSYVGGGGVEGIGVDITFDDTLLTPQTTGTSVDGCLSGADADLESCEQTAPNTIRVALTNLGGPELADQGGTITFDIAGTATVGDISALALSLASVVPAGSTVTLNDGSVEIVDVSAVLNVQPPNINFSATENGSSSAPETVTISNDGTDGIDLEVTDVSLATGTHFSVSDVNCGATPFSLSDGNSCDVEVTFSPTAIGNFNDSLDVTSDAGTTTNDSVALSGEGTAGPAATLDVSPASHDFGDVLTGESSTSSFTVSNSGDAGSSLDIDAIGLGGGTDFSISGGTCSVGDTLGDGDSCTVAVEFAPAADGAQSDTLTVDGTDTVNSTSVSDSAALDGNGVSEARFSSDPAPGAVNLGTAPPGGSLNQTVTVSNDGNENLTVNGCTLTDPDGLFSITPDPIDFSIAPDASDSFAVSCNVPEPGSFSASLSCDTNDPNNATVTYDFSCNGQVLEVPTMQTWGLVLLTLLMLMIGGLSIRYFRI